MPEDPRSLARRLAKKAVDPASTENEKVVCARKVCRLVVDHDLLGLEEHQKPSQDVIIQRVPGPFYLLREDAKNYVFVRWQESFKKRGIVHGAHRELVVPRGACTVSWMTDAEKQRELGSVPGNAVAAFLDVATARS